MSPCMAGPAGPQDYSMPGNEPKSWYIYRTSRVVSFPALTVVREVLHNKYAPINDMPQLAYLGGCWRKEGDLLSESFPRCWYLVRIVPIHSNCIIDCVKCLWKILDEFNEHPYLPVHYRNNTQDCAPGMGACSISIHISLSHTVHNRKV